VLETLQNKGASFFHDVVSASGLLPTQVEVALAELVSAGVVTADSFTGLRALLVPEQKRGSLTGERSRRRGSPSIYSVANAGRWSLLRAGAGVDGIEQRARAFLKRYGVVFRRLLARESGAPSWRDLVLVYRRMEARGEIRGGRFVAGVAGEQFALPDAIGLLRTVRKEPLPGTNYVISAADPLNLVGVITPELERVTASHRNRILIREGSAVAALEGRRVRLLEGHAGESEEELRRLLVHGPVAPQLRPYLRAPRSRRTPARQPQGQDS
jgi:ATP-dependent Lhr-like helicase